jgi:predicted HicB family RNase H-like nuclease
MSNHYTYRAEWSPEDGEYVGLVAEFPSLSWLAASAADAIAGIAQLVDDTIADMAETGETPPVPYTERRYSGNISVRTSPEQHRKLTLEAAEQGVSVNQWIIQKLAAETAAREPIADDEDQFLRRILGLVVQRKAQKVDTEFAAATAQYFGVAPAAAQEALTDEEKLLRAIHAK